jgi:hypothetical protein
VAAQDCTVAGEMHDERSASCCFRCASQAGWTPVGDLDCVQITVHGIGDSKRCPGDARGTRGGTEWVFSSDRTLLRESRA